jgi:hypothetical protein
MPLEPTIALSHLHEEWRVEWDGQTPTMAGPSTQSTRAFRDRQTAEDAQRVLLQTQKRPNIRIVQRWATEWKEEKND